MTALAWILLAAGAFLIALNYSALVVNYRNRRKGIDRHHSFVPLLGGLLGAWGVYLLGQPMLAVAVALSDPGIWVIGLLPVALLRQRRHQSKS